jgi:predicted sulfurtransferase
MKKLGFKKIYHLKDGILKWEKSIGDSAPPML